MRLVCSTRSAENKSEGGRLGDHTAKGLSGDFKKYGIELGRFKTGTPPRILGNTIDFSKTEKQSGDKNPVKFAFYDTRSDEEKFHVEHKSKFHVEQKGDLRQIDCEVTKQQPLLQISLMKIFINPLFIKEISLELVLAIVQVSKIKLSSLEKKMDIEFILNLRD